MTRFMQNIIAVDGYSSCGKSTFARMIGRKLNYKYIDSGAMYRAVAYYSIANQLKMEIETDKQQLIHSLDQIQIDFSINSSNGLQETLLNGNNVEKEIRSIEVSNIVSQISKIKEVREKMVGLQRSIGQSGKVVMDGRDIGTTVFPNAVMKIFMTADPLIRARRRHCELLEKGLEVDFKDVLNNIKTRDFEDENRKESPLRKAEDALVLDNSLMTPDDQMAWFIERWNTISDKHEN